MPPAFTPHTPSATPAEGPSVPNPNTQSPTNAPNPPRFTLPQSTVRAPELPQRPFVPADWGLPTPNAETRRDTTLAELSPLIETIADEGATVVERLEALGWLKRYPIDLAELLACHAEIDVAIGRAKAIRGMAGPIGELTKLVDKARSRAEQEQAKAQAEFEGGHTPPSQGQSGILDTVFPSLPPGTRLPADYSIINGTRLVRLGEPNEQGDRAMFPVASRPIVLTARAMDLDTGVHLREVSWLSDDREVKTAWIERGATIDTKQIVPALGNLGAPVASPNVAELARFFDAIDTQWAQSLPLSYTASRCGHTQGVTAGFMCGEAWMTSHTGSQPVGPSSVTMRPPVGMDTLSSAIVPHGTMEGWLSAWRTVEHLPIARLAVYIALASPLLTWTTGDGFIADFWRETSIGKTTALRLAASVWANPAKYLSKWDQTPTYIERTAELLRNLPLMLDDTRQLSAKAREGLGQTVYHLADGQGRGRGTGNGVQRRASWCLATLSTGEGDLLGSTRDEGARARTLSIEGSPFDSAERAVFVNVTTERHYGHFGPRFIQAVLDIGKPGIVAAYDEVLPYWLNRALPYGAVAGRLARHLAVIHVAAQLAHTQCGLPFEASLGDALEVAFGGAVASSQDADKPLSALRMVISRCAAQPTSFYGRHETTGDGAKVPHQGWLGKWLPDDQSRLTGTPSPICIVSHALRRWLSDERYDAPAILAHWKNRGWLDLPSNTSQGVDKSVRIGPGVARCVCIQGPAIAAAMGSGEDLMSRKNAAQQAPEPAHDAMFGDTEGF